MHKCRVPPQKFEAPQVSADPEAAVWWRLVRELIRPGIFTAAIVHETLPAQKRGKFDTAVDLTGVLANMAFYAKILLNLLDS